jgi:preprotein translocase subunit SecG
MIQVIQISQIVVSILLIIAILMQSSSSGLGSAFGGESSNYRTKRGAEKSIFTATVVLAVLFLGLSLANFFIG